MLQKFEGQPKDVIKDILIQTTLMNKILGKVALRRKNQPFHLHLEVQEVVIYGKNIKSPFNLGADLEYFNERHERMGDFCFIIGKIIKLSTICENTNVCYEVTERWPSV